MHVAMIVPADVAEEPLPFAATVRDLGHRIVTLSVSPLSGAIDPSTMRGLDLAFVQGYPHISLGLACALAESGIRTAMPPLHTMALLDHPLHWRRVLEREGVPVSPWLRVGPAADLGRDPRVSVLGFPVRVLRVRPGAIECELAADRDQLAAAGSRLGGPRGVIVERYPGGDLLRVFTGLTVAGPLLDTASEDGRSVLTLGLARHIEHALELAGPCVLTMAWERGGLVLESIQLVGDLGPEGAAFRAAGGEYRAFVESTLLAASATS